MPVYYLSRFINIKAYLTFTQTLLLILFLTLFQGIGLAQIGGNPDFSGRLGDETEFYAETKQVGQFFRRFNGEEGKDGERFYDGNPLYQDPEFRAAYLEILFDNESAGFSRDLKRRLIQSATEEGNPVLLDFHGPQWFAEVICNFSYYGQSQKLTLFMKLEADRLGHKWVIDKVYFDPYADMWEIPSQPADEDFLHPLSHELDFMNLAKVFRKTNDLTEYTPRGYTPDQLTLFLKDVRGGALAFETVEDVSFHFFQVPGWYFELKDVRRSGFNTGWLISRIEEAPGNTEEESLEETQRIKNGIYNSLPF
ncbi:MAG: hypothetical protein ACI959_000217 [Limisphaerales bacterium]|jgi:hypothetical protein